MSTKTVKRKKAGSQQSSLKRRIRQFYDSLNRGDFDRCFQMIDPRVRSKPSSVTLFQYENSLRQFLNDCGTVQIVEIEVALHLNEPNKLYEGRDFALGRMVCERDTGERRVFTERWVREGRTWFTRSTGFVVASGSKKV